MVARTGMLTALTDRNGNTITDLYNSANQLASITDTQGRVTTTGAYGTNGFITSLHDPAGRPSQYAYTGNYLTGYLDPATQQTTYAYDATGNLNQITDPLGNVTTLAYDGDRRVTSITRIDNPGAGTGPTTTFAYNAGATPNTVVTDANGHTTTHYYDTVGRVTQTIDARGKATSTSYTANSNVQQSTDQAGQITTYGYDSNNNRTSAHLPTGAATTWAYTNTGHPYAPTGMTDPQGNVLAYGYNTPGNRTSVTTGLATQNQYLYTYNGNGNGTVATATDPRGNATTYGYDGYGNLTSVAAPAPLGSTTLHYDGLSRPDYSIDGKGQQTGYQYDGLDRATRVSYQSGDNTTLAYDVVGNLTRLDDNDGTPRQTTFGYDRLNRQTSKTFLLPSDGTLTYAYDGVGNLTGFADGGGAVGYAYNAVNLLQTLTEPGGFQTTFTYDDMYHRTGTAYPNGVAMTQAYDNAGRLTSIVGKNAGGATLTSFTYTYQNATGADTALRQRVTDQDGNTTTYGYDALNRLTGAQTTGPSPASYAYAYDGANNRTGQTVNGATTTYGYNAADELTATGGTTYGYDAAGNQTGNSAGQALAYNTANQTTSVTPAGGTALGMTYTGGSQTQRVSAGSTGFQHSLLTLNRQIDTVGTTYYTRGAQGELLGQRAPTGRYYYLYDGLGSTAALTNSTGAVVNTYRYDPWGKLLGSTGTVANPYRFGGSYGAYTDVVTGLIKIGERYYDPALGRWVQRDPLGAGNAYAYANNNPANYADPSGLVTRNCSPVSGVWGPATQCAYTFSSAETTALGDDLLAGNTGAGIIGAALAGLGVAIPPVGAILVGLVQRGGDTYRISGTGVARDRSSGRGGRSG
jgi:RHS repeat-associated protein